MLGLVLALAAGVVAQSLARHLRIPGIVLLLAVGALLGPDLLGWVQPRTLGEGLFGIVDLAVAVILFEGGLNLELSRLRRAHGPIRRLVTLGALVTLAGGTLAARGILEWPWIQSILFGSLVVVTGPTVVGPLVSELRLRPRVATVLEAEGVLIDPIGAILAVLVLELTLSPGAEAVASETAQLLLRLGFGAVAGAIGGFALVGLLRVRRLVPEGFENIVTLAGVLLVFEGCDSLVSHSGILAVTVAGVVVGNVPSRVQRDLREFKDQLTVLLIGLLFVLLAADVRFADVQALGLRGLLVVAALVFVVRPLGVWLCTRGSELVVRERLLLAWIAPRGIVAAAIASLTATALETAGRPGGAELRALVFLTIACTVLLVGLTGWAVATALRQRLPGRETFAILGVNGLSLALGTELRTAGVPILYLDSNPQNCRLAEDAGFAVLFGDALQERMLTRARFETVGTAIGLTPNDALNGLFVSRAREMFSVPRAYVAVSRRDVGLSTELMKSGDAEVLFEDPHDVTRWDVRARHRDVEVAHWVWKDLAAETEESRANGQNGQNERFAVLAVRRGSSTLPMSTTWKLRDGDVAAIALYVPEGDEARNAIREAGWEPLPPAEAESREDA